MTFDTSQVAQESADADGMPDKRLMTESSVVDYTADDDGIPIEVTVLERWGKSKRRAKLRELDPNRREYVTGGGFICYTLGAVIHDGMVFEVEETSDRERWWVCPVDWGEQAGGDA